MKSILFADNDPDFLNTRAEFLELGGYRVVKAATLAEAERCLHDGWAPLAILDVRLVDDDDEKDLSGLGLARIEESYAAPKIILSGHLTAEVVRELLRQQESGHRLAVDVVSKEQGPEALIAIVNQAFAHAVHINWDLAIRWNAAHPLSFPHLASLIEPGLQSERLLDRADELEDLFRRLFYEKSQITIDRLLWQRNGRVAVVVFTFASDKPSEPMIVVCGPPARILDEWQRYKKFAPPMAGKSNTTLATASECAETTHFGAYALGGVPLDKSLLTLNEFHRSNPERRELQAVVDAMGATLGAWHQDQRLPTEPPASESELYRVRLGLADLTPADFEARLSALQIEAAAYGMTLTLIGETCQLRFNSEPIAFQNPYVYLFDGNAQEASPALCVVTPGTLTPGNVLVAPERGQVWFTDFADVGLAPPLWNFTALEAALRFDLLVCDELSPIYELEQRLTEAGPLNRLDTQTSIDKSVRPTLQWIETLRRKAVEVTGQPAEAYHRGLLFHAASRMVAFQPEMRLTRRETVRALHLLLAAGLTYEGLSKLHLADSDLKSAMLQLDQDNKMALVGARKVHLTPIEFKLLAYLAERAGHLCSHLDIIQHVWEPPKDPLDLRGTLNTTIGRLRDKIEPDPDRPRYLLTEHARGYKLVLQPEA